MITESPVPAKIHGTKLKSELVAKFGVPAEYVAVWVDMDKLVVEVPDGTSETAVRAAIKAHDGERPQSEKNRDAAWASLLDYIRRAEAVATDPNVWRTTRADEKDEIMRQGVLCIATLGRFLADTWEA